MYLIICTLYVLENLEIIIIKIKPYDKNYPRIFICSPETKKDNYLKIV